jgi:hypothetical protein
MQMVTRVAQLVVVVQVTRIPDGDQAALVTLVMAAAVAVHIQALLRKVLLMVELVLVRTEAPQVQLVMVRGAALAEAAAVDVTAAEAAADIPVVHLAAEAEQVI